MLTLTLARCARRRTRRRRRVSAPPRCTLNEEYAWRAHRRSRVRVHTHTHGCNCHAYNRPGARRSARGR
eukprot:scaffold59056_cov74-Phaeocystis_antarctica.AAC.5